MGSVSIGVVELAKPVRPEPCPEPVEGRNPQAIHLKGNATGIYARRKPLPCRTSNKSTIFSFHLQQPLDNPNIRPYHRSTNKYICLQAKGHHPESAYFVPFVAIKLKTHNR